MIWRFCVLMQAVLLLSIVIDYCYIIKKNSRSEAINLLENSVLENRGYI